MCVDTLYVLLIYLYTYAVAWSLCHNRTWSTQYFILHTWSSSMVILRHLISLSVVCLKGVYHSRHWRFASLFAPTFALDALHSKSFGTVLETVFGIVLVLPAGLWNSWAAVSLLRFPRRLWDDVKAIRCFREISFIHRDSWDRNPHVADFSTGVTFWCRACYSLLQPRASVFSWRGKDRNLSRAMASERKWVFPVLMQIIS